MRSYEKDYIVQMDISIEMNLDYTTLARTGYTTLDVLSDVGGIQSLLVSFFSILLGILNYNNFYNNMASRLYKVQRAPSSTNQHEKTSFHYNMQPTRFLNCFEWLFDSLPRFLRCKCCRKMRKMEEFDRARDLLYNEINIIEIVRSRRLI